MAHYFHFGGRRNITANGHALPTASASGGSAGIRIPIAWPQY